MKVKLKISGMHCGSCAGNVERAVKGVKGVKSASASAITNNCFIEFEGEVKEEDIKKAVAKTGYKVVSIE